MRILFLNTLDDPVDGGGAEVSMWSLLRGLVAAGHECALLVTSDDRGLERIDHDGVRVWSAGIHNLYWSGRRARPLAPIRLLWHALDSYNPFIERDVHHVLGAERPDIAVFHNLAGWSASAWHFVRRRGVPIVQVLHDQYAICTKSTAFRSGHNCERRCTACRVLRLPHRHLSNNVSAVIGVSRFILDRHLSQGFFARVPIRRVVFNARDCGSLGVNGTAGGHSGVRMGYIGRLDRTKGVEMLLQAFHRYGRSDAELWIAGTGKRDYETRLRNSVADSRVRFLGRVAPADFYPNIDFTIAPSLWNEPFGLVVTEALAFGKPVIASRRGGIPEIIRNGENGLLFDAESPDALLTAIRSLGDDAELRGRMGRQSRLSAARFTDISSWVRQHIDIYREVLSGETA